MIAPYQHLFAMASKKCLKHARKASVIRSETSSKCTSLIESATKTHTYGWFFDMSMLDEYRTSIVNSHFTKH